MLHVGQCMTHHLICTHVYAVGAIVGGVVGGLAVVYLMTTIMLALVLQHRRKRLRQIAAQQMPVPETKALAAGHRLETGARPEVWAAPATVNVQAQAQ